MRGEITFESQHSRRLFSFIVNHIIIQESQQSIRHHNSKIIFLSLINSRNLIQTRVQYSLIKQDNTQNMNDYSIILNKKILISLEVWNLSNRVIPIFPRSVHNWVAQYIPKDPVTQLPLLGLQNLLLFHPKILLSLWGLCLPSIIQCWI